MNDPFALLGVAEDADDETVRKAYLHLVRIHSPDKDAARFQEIRAAYENIAQASDRLSHRLFEAPKPDPVPLVAAWLRGEEKQATPSALPLIALLRESLKSYRLPDAKAGAPSQSGAA
ncbi:MAG: DnaJ domain-containing protein [Magnetococcales bacterium]|nr:DnaJ domain-containing protein [Magnetococcales bacterium]